MASSEETKRFAEPSEDDVSTMLEKAVPDNTRKATDAWVTVFKAFCSERKMAFDMSTCSAEELNKVLCQFYPSLRTKKGEMYKKSSYFAARAALHRRIQELKRPFNLFKTAVFTESHRVFDATLKMKKVDGLEPAVVHKEAITQEDRARLAEYFEDVLRANDPIKLSMYAWYWITLHFGLRAREVQVQLRKTDLVFNEGKDGVFITLATDFSSKNCQGGASGRDFNTVGRIDNPQQVAAIRLLLEKLHPAIDRFFQRARTGRVQANDKTWFTRQVLGHNLLGQMMERISNHAGLSTRYTNHSVRATCVSVLKERGVGDRTVCAVTGHKSERSLSSYAKPNNEEQKQLSTYLDQSASTIPMPPASESPASSSNERTSAAPGFTINGTVTVGSLTMNFGGRVPKRKQLCLSKTLAKKQKLKDGSEVHFSESSSATCTSDS